MGAPEKDHENAASLLQGEKTTEVKVKESSSKKKAQIRNILIGVAVLIVVIILIIILVAVILVVLIKDSEPSLIFQPNPDGKSTLIHFAQGKPETYGKYKTVLLEKLQEYENDEQVGENVLDCDHLTKEEKEAKYPGKVCRFKLDELGHQCVRDRDFGYNEGNPCVLLQLKQKKDWFPESYTNSHPPPRHAFDHGMKNDSWKADNVAVSCYGVSQADKEAIGVIEYWPRFGFRDIYFPYKEQEMWKAPLVMVQFTSPKNGVAFVVKCQAWAQNLDYTEDIGSVQFEILVD